MFCKQCGTEIGEGSKFCTNCGWATDIDQSNMNDPNVGATENAFGSAGYSQPQTEQPPYQQQSSQRQTQAQSTHTQFNFQPVDIDQMRPRKVNFGEAIKLFFSNYANFSDRASRSEYWWVVLFNLLIEIGVQILEWILKPHGQNFVIALYVVYLIYSLAIIIPGLALAVRRLHDVGKSGWNMFLILIPIVGGIILLVYLCKDSEGDNAWGLGPADYYDPLGNTVV